MSTAQVQFKSKTRSVKTGNDIFLIEFKKCIRKGMRCKVTGAFVFVFQKVMQYRNRNGNCEICYVIGPLG